MVVPGIPGFGLSGPTTEPGWEAGWEARRVADAWAELLRRLGYERAHHRERVVKPSEASAVPTALALFPAEPRIPLRHKARRTENLVRRTEFDRGGHFAAMEEPGLLVGDVRAFFRQLREGSALS